MGVTKNVLLMIKWWSKIINWHLNEKGMMIELLLSNNWIVIKQWFNNVLNYCLNNNLHSGQTTTYCTSNNSAIARFIKAAASIQYTLRLNVKCHFPHYRSQIFGKGLFQPQVLTLRAIPVWGDIIAEQPAAVQWAHGGCRHLFWG